MSAHGIPKASVIALGMTLGVSFACSDRVALNIPSMRELALIPKTSDNRIFDLVNQGAQRAKAELSAEGYRVSVPFMAPLSNNIKQQEEQLQAAIDQRMDGIIVSCIDDRLSVTINRAVDEGIPVITYDSDCPRSKRMLFYGTNNEETGSQSADLLVRAMGAGSKRVAILAGSSAADNLEKRVRGFTEQMERNHGDVQVEDPVYCEGEGSDACGVKIEELVDADLDGLFIAGYWGLDSCSCVDPGEETCTCDQIPKWHQAAQSGKLKTVAYDSLPFELSLVKQGYVSALIGQRYFDWGQTAVKHMVHFLVDGEQPEGQFIYSESDIICNVNVDEMFSRWNNANKAVFQEVLTPTCL